MSRRSTALLAGLGASLVAFPVLALEMPSEAQKEALRTDCRDDFIKLCKGVEPGGLPALECLEQHISSLSQTCQGAVQPVEKETGTGG